MSYTRILIFLSVLPFALFERDSGIHVPEAEWLIQSVTVLYPESGATLPGRTVAIAGDRILEVGLPAEIEAPEDAEVIDGEGLYLMPGMWDLHTHMSFADENAGPLMITQGVTGARDMGAVLEEIETIRDRIERGDVLGPRIVRAGPTLNGAEYGPHQRVIDSAEAARSAVQELDSLGIDVIKTHNATGRNIYFALLDAAKEAELPVVGHVPKEVSPLEACESGQGSIDHIATIFEGVYMQRFDNEMQAFQSMSTWLENEASALIKCMASQETLFVPTLYTYFFRANRAALYENPPSGWQYLTPSSRETYRTENKPSGIDQNPGIIALRMSLVEVGQAFTRMVYEAGGPIGTGSDFAGPGIVPGFSIHQEINLLVEAGLPPHAAIWAATRGPGPEAGADPQTGRIEAGAPADLVLLRANPFDDIGALSEIEGVGFRGQWLNRGELDDVLESLAAD